MSTKKYISLDRMQEYDTLIKQKIASGDTAILDSSKLYTDEQIGNHEHSWNDLLDKPFGEEESFEEFYSNTITGSKVRLKMADVVDLRYAFEIMAYIEWDGVKYYLPPEFDETYHGIGNPSLSSNNNIDTGEPFFIEDQLSGDWIIYSSTGTHSFAFYKATTGIKTLDEQYIPSTIARIADIPTELPAVTSSNAGQVLTVNESGVWSATTIDVYSKAEVDAAIAEAIGAAIGGSY